MHSPRTTPATESAPVRPFSGLVLSLGFWGCLFAAAVLFGCVSLAPRLVERAGLERNFADRQGELLTLQGEVARLDRVATGLRDDVSFAAMVARHELQQPAGTVWRLPVQGGLHYDPRVLPPEPVDVTYHEPWYLPILVSLAERPERRLRWSLLASALLMFGFVFLHDHAGSRAVGAALVAPVRRLARRYIRRTPATPGCPSG